MSLSPASFFFVRSNTRGRCIALKLKLRKPNAPPPPKFMGHGWCDNVSRSVTLASSVEDKELIAKEAIDLLLKLEVDPLEIRGIGIQITKLDDMNIGGGASKQKKKGQSDIAKAYERAERRKEPRLKEFRLSDIDVNEQKYILSMIERNCRKNAEETKGASGSASGAGSTRKEQPKREKEEKRVLCDPTLEAIDSSAYSFQIGDIISLALEAGALDPEALVQYVLDNVKNDIEKVRRVLKAVRIFKDHEILGNLIERAQELIKTTYGGALQL